MPELAVPVPATYPVRLDVDYPERQSRWKALLRLPLSVPLIILVFLLSGILFYGVLPAMWIIALLRGRIPRWLFDFVVAINRTYARVQAYLWLLTDEYAPFEGIHPLRLDVEYPQRVSRWQLVIWKLVTAIPHLFVLQVLVFAVSAVTPIAWLFIIFTRQFPRGLHQFVASVLRWQQRVVAYMMSLTDVFPPFSLDRDAGRAGTRSYAVSAALGALLIAGAIGAIVAAVLLLEEDRTVVTVSYDDLREGRTSLFETAVVGDTLGVALQSATDPAEDLSLLVAEDGERFITFDVLLSDLDRDVRLSPGSFALKDTAGDGHDVILALADGRPLPARLEESERSVVTLIFELEIGVDPYELRYDPDRFDLSPLVYRFE